MSKPTFYFLVKTFSEQFHRDQFLDGILYLNPLDYFVKLEAENSTGRGDFHEGITAWLQPEKIKIELNGFQLSSADLAAPVSLRPTRNLVKNVFCMHAGYIGGNLPSEFATTDEFELALRIPSQNLSLGMHTIVVTNVKDFLQRVKTAAIKNHVTLRGGLVEYYDPATFHGHFPEHQAPFKKQNQFAHQREYRLVLDRQADEGSPYVLNVGNLRDIAHVISIDSLNTSIKIFRT